ncbi:dihydrofolate reductase family protein [soil metagenome]
MKIILVMVTTINGKSTNGDVPGTSSWASSEDQDFFFNVLKANDLLIMGRKTYEAAKNFMQLTPDRLRIVLTSRPDIYQADAIDGQLEFTSDMPSELVKKVEDRGYTQALLLGGEKTNTDFLKENLVDELWLTIEPKIFGKGNSMIGNVDFNLSLKLLSCEKLNTTGSLLVKYSLR